MQKYLKIKCKTFQSNHYKPPPFLFLLNTASLTHGPCQAMQEKESSEKA